MTHLFAADEADGRITDEQLQAHRTPRSTWMRAAGLNPEWLNVGNSAALLAGQAAKIAALAARHQMKALMRPGLALYGLVPASIRHLPRQSRRRSLPPARSFGPCSAGNPKSSACAPFRAGAVVGYNGTFVATEPMRLALIAAGYADGLDRRLGNRFSLLVRGQRAPLVGRISMDQSVLDVTEIPGVAAGDEVVMLGAQGGETISAFDHAEAAGTIPWEIFTRIGARVPRIAV